MMQVVGSSLLILLLAAYSYFLVLGYRALDANPLPLFAVPIGCAWTLLCLTGLVLGGDWREPAPPALAPHVAYPTTFSLAVVAIIYLAYAIGAIATMHAFLWTFATYREHKAQPISKNYPRYLDYAYCAAMAIGLGQILVFSTELASYYESRLESEQDTIQTVKEMAQATVDGDCSRPHNNYFTDDYCDKMSTIATAPNDELKRLLLTKFLPDQAFMAHVVGTGTLMSYTFGGGIPRQVPLRNPMAEPIARLKVHEDYKSLKTGDDAKAAIGWLGLLVLPWAIGLRVVKTSMELFVPMVDPPPRRSVIPWLRPAAQPHEEQKPARPDGQKREAKAEQLAGLRKTSLPPWYRLARLRIPEDTLVLGGLAGLFVWTYVVLPLVFYHH